MNRPTKAMLLTAGLGSRLRPLTAYRAKPTVPMVGRPLIEYQLRMLAEWGVDEVVANLHHGRDELRRVLESCASEQGIDIAFSVEDELMGTAGGLALAAEKLRGMQGETFLLMNGDTLAQFDLDDLASSFDDRLEATILLRDRPVGVAHTSVSAEGGKVLGIGGEGETMGPYMFAGVWIAHHRMLERLSGEPRGLETEVMPVLIQEGLLGASVQDCEWLTIDTPRRYLNACRAMLRRDIFRRWWAGDVVDGLHGENGRVVASAGCRISDSASLNGEVILGENCRIDSGAEIQNCVLWNDVHVRAGASMRNSILCDGVEVAKNTQVNDQILMRVEGTTERFRSDEVSSGMVRTPLAR